MRVPWFFGVFHGARRPLPALLVFLLVAALPCSAATFHGVGIKALDGDSILAKLDNGLEIEVRLLNVDAPEHGQELSDEARAFTGSRISGKAITLVTEVDQRDRYNRLLALVNAGGRCVNLDLVEAGLALAYLIPPNTSRADEFLSAQGRAHAAKLGVWGSRGLREAPRSYRGRTRHESGSPPVPLRYEDWLITGNTKSCVAHWPGCRHVDDIAPANRVRFESVREAQTRAYRMEKGYE